MEEVSCIVGYFLILLVIFYLLLLLIFILSFSTMLNSSYFVMFLLEFNLIFFSLLFFMSGFISLGFLMLVISKSSLLLIIFLVLNLS